MKKSMSLLLISVLILLTLLPFATGDGIPFPPRKAITYDFSAIKERQQYAVVDVKSNYFEQINLYLALSSLDFEEHNTTIIIPLKSIPQDVDSNRITEKEFLSKYEFDKIQDKMRSESFGEFIKRVDPKTKILLEDYLLSSIFSPLHFLSRIKYPGYGPIYAEGIFALGGTKELPPGVTYIKRFEFEGGYMDIYSVESGQTLQEFLKEYELEIPENVKLAIDRYKAYYIAVLNLEIKPIADISLLKEYAPNTLKDAIEYIRENPDFNFTCYDYGYEESYSTRKIVPPVRYRCDEREIIKQKFNEFIERAKREYIKNVRHEEPIKSTITRPKEKLWESVDDGQYVLNKDAEYFEGTATYFTSGCFPNTYNYDDIEFRLNYIKDKNHARVDLTYNKKVTIPVDSIAREFYLFVGGNTGNVYLDTREYVYSTDIDLKLIYEDSTEKKISAEIPWDWSSGRDYTGINSKTIYIGKNPCDTNSRAAMYMIMYANPYPEKKVKYIELADDFTADYPSTNIVAITFSQKESRVVIPTTEIETAMIDFFLNAYSNKTNGMELSISLPIKDNEIYYPLGTGISWSTPIEDTKIMVDMDKNLDANFKNAQSSTIYKDKRYYLWEFKNWNPDYDIIGTVKQSGFSTWISDSFKSIIRSMNENSGTFAWFFAFLVIMISVIVASIMKNGKFLKDVISSFLTAILAPFFSLWIIMLLQFSLKTKPGINDLKILLKRNLILFGLIFISWFIFLIIEAVIK